MRNLIGAVATVSLLAIALPASADVYANIGYSHLDVDDVDLNFSVVTGRLGWNSGRWFGVEGEASTTLRRENIGALQVDLESQYALYGVATYPMNDKTNLFARVGYGSTKVTSSAAAGTASRRDESWNYGVGGQYLFGGGDNGLRADYTRMAFDNGGDANVFSISYVWRLK